MTWESHNAIEKLIYAYARSVDLARWDELARLFTYGQVRTNSNDEVTKGGEAVAAQWASVNKVHEDGTLRTRHLITNVDIDIDEGTGRATAQSTFMVFQGTSKVPLQPIAGGSYRDSFRRLGETWWFEEKFIEVALVGNVSDHLAISLDAPG
jgi:3-phenylpropionate/cinnamic acid dioxygenase small subunit